MNNELREWELAQMRVFLKWVNNHLKERGLQVDDLFTGFHTGHHLIQLYEIVSGENLRKYNPNPKMKVHQVENLNIVLEKINGFTQKIGIKTFYSAEQILASEKKQILGMIWVLISKFELAIIAEREAKNSEDKDAKAKKAGEQNAKESLLLWCKKQLKGLVDVENFSASWKNGLAFCGLVHKYNSKLLNFNSLDKEDARTNLTTAFQVAEEQLGIPCLLDVDDMLNYVDEKSVMTQVTYYYKKIASSQKSGKAVATLGQSLNKLANALSAEEEYKSKANELVNWINSTIQERFCVNNLGNGLKSITTDITSFNENFKKQEKGEQLEKKSKLELVLASVRAKQQLAGLAKIFTPEESISISAINAQWELLEQKQQEYELALRDRLTLMKKLHIVYERFVNKAKRLENWQNDKIALLQGEDLSKYTTVSAMEARMKSLRMLSEESNSISSSITQLEESVKELVESENPVHESKAEVEEQLTKLNNNMEKFSTLSSELFSQLKANIENKLQLLSKCLEYAKIADTLNLFLDDSLSSLNESIPNISSTAEMDVYTKTLDKLVEDSEGYEPYLEDLTQIYVLIEEGGAIEELSAFSNVSIDALREKFEMVKSKVEERRVIFDELNNALQASGELVAQYNEYCASYVQWVTSEKDNFSAVNNGSQSLEETLETMKSIAAEKKAQSSAYLVEMQDQYGSLERMQIIDQCNYIIGQMERMQSELESFFKNEISIVEEQILAQTKKNNTISDAQLLEFKESFNTFDRDGDNSLTMLEFKALLGSFGEEKSDEEVSSIIQSVEGSDVISFDQFIQFMTKESSAIEELLEGFKSIANGAASISEEQIKNSGLEAGYVDYFLAHCPVLEDGSYDYNTFVTSNFN